MESDILELLCVHVYVITAAANIGPRCAAHGENCASRVTYFCIRTQKVVAVQFRIVSRANHDLSQ